MFQKIGETDMCAYMRLCKWFESRKKTTSWIVARQKAAEWTEVQEEKKKGTNGQRGNEKVPRPEIEDCEYGPNFFLLLFYPNPLDS